MAPSSNTQGGGGQSATTTFRAQGRACISPRSGPRKRSSRGGQAIYPARSGRQLGAGERACGNGRGTAKNGPLQDGIPHCGDALHRDGSTRLSFESGPRFCRTRDRRPAPRYQLLSEAAGLNRDLRSRLFRRLNTVRDDEKSHPTEDMEPGWAGMPPMRVCDEAYIRIHRLVRIDTTSGKGFVSETDFARLVALERDGEIHRWKQSAFWKTLCRGE